MAGTSRDVVPPSTSKVLVEKRENESDAEKDPSRRPSKDESSSSSSDSPSGDEYNVYYYDPKAAASAAVTEGKDAKLDLPGGANASAVLGNLKKTEDPWDVLFARAEGLSAHGHTREACILGIKLAEELLANPPDLMIEVPPMPVKGKRKKVQNRFSYPASQFSATGNEFKTLNLPCRGEWPVDLEISVILFSAE